MCIQVNFKKEDGKTNFMAALGAIPNPSKELIENVKRLAQESEQNQPKPIVTDDSEYIIGHA